MNWILLAVVLNPLNETWIDHKCFVTDSHGEPRVHFFQLPKGKERAFQAELVGRAMRDGFGNPTATVTEVKQCVGMYGEFKDPIAQDIDAAQGH